jgi:curved DNA-binding protein CbpA
MKTLYDLLGVRSDANAEAVKKAFRRAVKAHHPDLNADEDAAERFREIIAANGILRDIEQRAAYDRHLELERQRLWLEWKRAVVQCLIAAAVSSAAVVGASTFFVALPTAATVHGKTEEAARRSTDLTAVRLAASDGSNAQDETVDKHENTKAASTAIETNVAPPATIRSTDMGAVRLAASDGSNAQDETVDKHEDTNAISTAIETSVAPPATIRSTDLTAVRLAASDGSNAQDETVDRHENTKAASTAIETSVAPPATIIGTDHPITRQAGQVRSPRRQILSRTGNRRLPQG